ncbi:MULTISPECIES: SIS domain-containing protein [unclassified Roseofilum]|uniref:D-sedoheptulose-7-phosphate isomerase n=1 Tax=unclassified Roseofilum TaxID=2620099 RepID=UPI000E90574F|nr:MULTISPECIES: SIS domain-containing protein [unclassified Roseofilum]MBP0010146.1 SIS domain-containing protein [Roseofilum sp. Belize Diploria]MBP0032048.1 SIS domain-containing protein [Roseofilum sp. Belize BBD 4]HBQ98617.1 phosphoheptose isomerase [Cyanobacteria bacterium UBA11691]
MPLDVEEQKERIRNHLLGSIWVKQQVVEQCLDSILIAADLITNTFGLGGKLLLCGNGGSAADCQHMASELVSRLTKAFDRPGLPAIALTTDTSYLTAFTNDCGYEGVFERQVQALGKPQDLLMGISTSGNSPNIIRAITKANEREIVTIALTGNKGGQLLGIARQSIVVPSTDTQYIQESHLAIEHILCDLVEQQLFG